MMRYSIQSLSHGKKKEKRKGDEVRSHGHGGFSEPDPVDLFCLS